MSFTYNSTGYTLKFTDEGMFEWATDDLNTYGKVELIKDGKTVLGLDISQDLSKGDGAFWRMTGVYAFLPGAWMTDLIEMAAYIDGMHARERDQWQNADALARAKQIKLPD